MHAQLQPLVSIVTPVYNEAEHLSHCIESVLSQTYQNWDYSIVDNCSTDGSLEIANRYAAKDKRIRVRRNTELLGAIANHNAAVREISPASRYCKVVFGDDLIFPECLELMVGMAEAHPSAGIIGAYSLEGGRLMCAGLPDACDFMSGRDVCRKHLLDKLYLWGSANTVLYRADLVRSRDPFFNEAHTHSDTEVCFDMLKESDFGFVHQRLTFTRTRPGSLNTISSNMGTYLAGMLHVLVKYGPDILGPEEIEACLERHLAGYYRFLGKNLIFGRGKKFWSYHKGQLAEAGVAFSRMAVFRGALLELARALLAPKRTAKLTALLGREKSEPSQTSMSIPNPPEGPLQKPESWENS